MVSVVRPADVFDLFRMQHVNLVNLPENYAMKYYLFHAIGWPQLPSVALDASGEIVGYVLAKLEGEENGKPQGHVTSVAVLRQSRKLGIASKLMKLTHAAMQTVFDTPFTGLHVRVTNRAAFTLYSRSLGYKVYDVDKGYYADNEDAFHMRKYFKQEPRRRGKKDDAEEGTAS